MTISHTGESCSDGCRYTDGICDKHGTGEESRHTGEGWEERKIIVQTKLGSTEYTLDQLFNDVALGQKVAFANDHSLESHQQALSWLKLNVKAFISQVREEAKVELFQKACIARGDIRNPQSFKDSQVIIEAITPTTPKQDSV